MAFKKSYNISCIVHSEMLDDDIVYNDIHSYRIVKAPFSKTSTVTSITIEADQESLIILENEIKTNQFPKMVVYIFDSAKKITQPTKVLALSDMLKKSTYQIIGCTEEGRDLKSDNDQFGRGRRIYTFILTHPILFWLSNNHGFNSIQIGQAYNVIGKYEDYLKNTFGDMFDFVKYTEPNDITNHGYENILTRSNMDNEVPREMLVKYKALKSIGYYFMDDFHIGDDIYNKQVICNLFSFGSLKQMPKVDLDSPEYRDTKISIKITASYPILDYHLNFQSQSTMAFVESPSGLSEISIPVTMDKLAIKNINQTKLKYNVNQDRTINTSKDMIIGGLSVPNSHILLYTPDTPQLAVSRFNDTKQLITQQLRSYLDIMIDNVDMNVFELNKLYNLSERAIYNFTPVLIDYEFNRKGSKSTSKELICSVRVKFIEFEETPTLV